MNEPHSDNKKLAAKLDIMPMAVSLALILALCLAFFLAPNQSKHVLDSVRFFIGEEFGVYYLAVGLGGILCGLLSARFPKRLYGALGSAALMVLFFALVGMLLPGAAFHLPGGALVLVIALFCSALSSVILSLFR